MNEWWVRIDTTSEYPEWVTDSILSELNSEETLGEYEIQEVEENRHILTFSLVVDQLDLSLKTWITGVLEENMEPGEAVHCVDVTLLGPAPALEYEFDESMDGDHDSAMASAGWGTDEDYGSY